MWSSRMSTIMTMKLIIDSTAHRLKNTLVYST